MRPMADRKHIGFSVGASSPRSLPNIDAFERNLERADTWLSPFEGFGPSNFLVGYPEFDFETYHGWFDERFPPAKFSQLKDKMGPMVQYPIGAFIQSLTQNPGLEAYLQSLGTRRHIYIGTGLGDITVTADEALRLDRAQRQWNEFWATPERCEALREHFDGEHDPHAPRDPTEFSSAARIGSTPSMPGKRSGRSGARRCAISRRSGDDPSEPVPPSSGSAKLVDSARN